MADLTRSLLQGGTQILNFDTEQKIKAKENKRKLALKKRKSDSDFEQFKIKERNDALLELSKRDGEVGVHAASKLLPGLNQEVSRDEARAKMFLSPLLKQEQFDTAGALTSKLELPNPKQGPLSLAKSKHQKALAGSADALADVRKQQLQIDKDRAAATLSLIQSRKKEVERRIDKIDKEISKATTMSDLRSAQQNYLLQLESLQEEKDELQNNFTGMYLRNEDGEFVGPDGDTVDPTAVTDPQTQLVLTKTAQQQIAELDKSIEKTRNRLQVVGDITAERIGLNSLENPDERESIQDQAGDMSLGELITHLQSEGVEPERAREMILEQYPNQFELKPQAQRDEIATRLYTDFATQLADKPADRDMRTHQQLVIQSLIEEYGEELVGEMLIGRKPLSTKPTSQQEEDGNEGILDTVVGELFYQKEKPRSEPSKKTKSRLDKRQKFLEEFGRKWDS